MTLEERQTQLALEPQNWDDFRQLAHQMVDDMVAYLSTVRDRPVWQPIPEDVKARFQAPLPEHGAGEAAAYADFMADVMPYPFGNIHPRFWGWVMGSGLPIGVLAELLAATVNPNQGGGEQAGNYVEHQVINWCKQMLQYPSDASGLLVSGGSMANLVGLTVARNAKAEVKLRECGVGGAPRPMTLYASREAHSSIKRAVELLGLGSEYLRSIPVDEEFRINLDALQDAIRQDREAGFYPFCVVGCAGTVNTGAFDDLDALADICEREGLWFHVDGAFGALAALVSELQPLTKGMRRADSLAFDLHKWMYMPFEVGCALVRHPDQHRRAFTETPDYLAHGTRGPAGGPSWLSDYGIQLSRGFRALKVWMGLKTHGIEAFSAAIHENVLQARYLADLVDQQPALERLAPVPLNIVCFRYVDDRLSAEQLNALNEELLLRLHESGAAVPSYTKIDGKYAIRAANTNHRTQREDFEFLVREVVRLGQQLSAEMAPTG